jgi:hypothetical protein
MRTLALILMEAGPLSPGLHLHIDNPAVDAARHRGH